MNARIQALKVLNSFFLQRKKLSDLDKYFKFFSDQDKRFFSEIVFGVVRFYFQLDFIAKTAIKKPLRKKDLDVYTIILIGIYQLLYLDVEDHASIYESVEMAVKIKKPNFKNFINAVLREIQRNVKIKDGDLKIFDKNKNPIFIPENIYYSFPLWLFDKLKTCFPDEYLQIIKFSNLRPNLSLRIDLNKVSQEKMLNILKGENILAKKSDLSIYGINLDKSINPLNIPFFYDGFFVVQNESAQILGNIVDLRNGMKVLDACAAPGGKTTHLLQINPNIQLTSSDISEKRLSILKENLDMLGLKADIIRADSSLKWTDKKFDLIILDAPCSGVGVINKHPEIKINLTQEHLNDSINIQRKILTNLWQMLEKNGSLIYITCSILFEETEQQIEYLLNKFDNIEVVHNNIGKIGKYGFYIIPFRNRHGFYYSKLTKK